VLRQRALPGVDFKNPAEVLASLNDRFPSDSHGGLYFTMWYGVYRTEDRTLTFGSAGHGPAFLVPADKSGTKPLGVPALMIGLLPAQSYDVQRATVPEGSTFNTCARTPSATARLPSDKASTSQISPKPKSSGGALGSS